MALTNMIQAIHPTIPTFTPNAARELRSFFRMARAPRLRRMSEFAEAELILPDGPFKNLRFRCDRQPYTKLWFDAVDSGLYDELVATGPTQSGKTYSCFCVPIMFHVFEIVETVICGLPNMDMAGDKWRVDLLPAIEHSRYKDLLPTSGPGSRGGGNVDSIRFKNGATLKFMSGGGGDKSRAAFTARVVVITETDDLDEPGKASREADKIKQIEARTLAFAAGQRRLIYKECTVTVPEGHTWQRYTKGTQSRIVLPCPHCRDWVSPEREHLVGHEEAETEFEAFENSAFHCPSCGEAWSDTERTTANAQCKLIHKGQTIDTAGVVSGAPPPTRTLGFRWSAVNNNFITAGELGHQEFIGRHEHDEENAEKEACQFRFCIPYEPAGLEDVTVDFEKLRRRTRPWSRGLVPDGTKFVTIGLDVGKRLLHWVAIAWLEDGRAHIVDYGRIDVASDDLGEDRAILIALREFRDDICEPGFAVTSGEPFIPNQVWIDSGWVKSVNAIDTFIAESTPQLYRAFLGRGAGQTVRERERYYNEPKTTGTIVSHIGEQFHFVKMPNRPGFIVEVNSDYWKSQVHSRLITPPDAEGSMSLFSAGANEHISFAKHLTAEHEIEEYVAGKGIIRRWIRDSRNNHWFDGVYAAAASANFCGVRTIARPKTETPVTQAKQKTTQPVRMPDGRAYLITERE